MEMVMVMVVVSDVVDERFGDGSKYVMKPLKARI